MATSKQETDMRQLRLDAAVDLSEGPAVAKAVESDFGSVEEGSSSITLLHPWHELLKSQQAAETPPASTAGDWELISPSKASACGSSTRSIHGSEYGDNTHTLSEEGSDVQPVPDALPQLALLSDLTGQLGDIRGSPNTCNEALPATVEVEQVSPDGQQLSLEHYGIAAQESQCTTVASVTEAEDWAGEPSTLCQSKSVSDTDDITQVGLTWVMSWFTSTPQMDACQPQSHGGGVHAYLQAVAGQLRSFVSKEWTAVGLGAGMIILGTMLASSYMHNRRLSSMLRTKDREVAKLVMKILSMQDSLQGRRFPIVRHTAWATLPAELM